MHEHGGGIERRIVELGRAQARRGHEVVIYSADITTATTKVDGFELRTLACRRSGMRRTLELAKTAVAQLRHEPADVVHFHSVPEGAFLARKLQAKKFLSYDFFEFRRGKSTPLYWLYRRLLRRFDCLLPVSDYCCRESAAYWNLGTAPMQVLFNGVNLDQFSPDEATGRAMRASLGIGDEPVVLYVGRVCEQKGTDVLLDAYSILKQQAPAARLVIAGPAARFGNTKGSSLTARIREVGGVYLGAVHESQLRAVHNLGDIFVMPTRTLEMFGMAAIEAQACGKPVICSRHGGLVEVISDHSGLFFPVEDAEALAQCILGLLGDGVRYRAMASAARQNAARFSWDRIAADFDEIYSGCTRN